jgi:hypothetical protein
MHHRCFAGKLPQPQTTYTSLSCAARINRPDIHLPRGDSGFGNKPVMRETERCGQFKLRLTKKVPNVKK